MRTFIAATCFLGYASTQLFDYSAGGKWSDGMCGDSKQSPIEIPKMTTEFDAEVGGKSETSKNKKSVTYKSGYTLDLGWDSSGTAKYIDGSNAAEGVLGYYFSSSKDNAATTLELTDTVVTTDEEGNETSTTETVIEESELISFLVRSPSEHTINGERMDVEVQYFYEGGSDSTKLSALAVLYDVETGGEDTASALLKEILDKKGQTLKLKTYNSGILGDDPEFVSYSGSYTNPLNDAISSSEIPENGCQTEMTWVVLTDVQKMSTAQQTSFLDLWTNNADFPKKTETMGNARSTQKLDGRKLFSNKIGPVKSGASGMVIATFASLAALAGFNM